MYTVYIHTDNCVVGNLNLSTRKQRLFVYFEEGQINKTFVVHIKLYFIKTTKKHTTRYELSDIN